MQNKTFMHSSAAWCQNSTLNNKPMPALDLHKNFVEDVFSILYLDREIFHVEHENPKMLYKVQCVNSRYKNSRNSRKVKERSPIFSTGHPRGRSWIIFLLLLHWRFVHRNVITLEAPGPFAPAIWEARAAQHGNKRCQMRIRPWNTRITGTLHLCRRNPTAPSSRGSDQKFQATISTEGIAELHSHA